MLEREEMWETEGVLDEAICMAVDVPDLKDESIDDEAKEDGLEESNGVDSDAGGSPVLVLASRLHTGQKVLHVVSQESTQKAWNSAQSSRMWFS